MIRFTRSVPNETTSNIRDYQQPTRRQVPPTRADPTVFGSALSDTRALRSEWRQLLWWLFVCLFSPFNWAELVSLLQRGFETPPNKKSPNGTAGSLTFPSRSLFLCRPMICRSKGRLLFPRSTCSYLQVRLHEREISTAEFFKYVNVTDLKKVVIGSSWSFACFNHIHPSGKQTQGSGI